MAHWRDVLQAQIVQDITGSLFVSRVRQGCIWSQTCSVLVSLGQRCCSKERHIQLPCVDLFWAWTALLLQAASAKAVADDSFAPRTPLGSKPTVVQLVLPHMTLTQAAMCCPDFLDSALKTDSRAHASAGSTGAASAKARCIMLLPCQCLHHCQLTPC